MSEVNTEELTNAEWAARFASMDKWLRAWPASAEANMSIFRNWVRWLEEAGGPVAGLSPDDLVEFQDGVLQNGSSRERYLLLDRALDYIQANEGRWRLTYQRKVLSSIRSFFKTNRAELPDDGTMWRQIENVPHVDEAPEHFVDELETLQRVLIKCNPMYRAFFMAMVAGGMGEAEVLEWSGQGVESLEPFVFEGVRLLRVNLPSRKGNNKAWYTVIGGDALKELDGYLAVRERKRTRFEELHHGEAYPDTVFVTNLNTPLVDDSTVRTYWLRKLDSLGIIDREGGGSGTRYGYHPHQLRDVFSTLVHGKMDKDVREFLMGHVVDSNKYDQFYRDPEYVYREYLRALPYLNLITGSLPYGKADATQVDGLQRRISELEVQLEREVEEAYRRGQRDLREELKAKVEALIGEEMKRVDGEWRRFSEEFRELHGEMKKMQENFKKQVQEVERLREPVK